MLANAAVAAMISILLSSGAALPPQDVQPPSPGPSKPQITIYPILAQIPIFGAVIEIPDAPGNPGGSGTTDRALNGAYMFGGILETRHWLVDVNSLWADVSARKAQPQTHVDTGTRFVNATAGLRAGGGLFVVGGVKRVSVDLDVSVTGRVSNTTLDGKANTVLWDPMAGVAYRGRLTARTTCDVGFKVGGFGIGTDYDVTTEGAVDWSIARRMVLRAGYSFVRYKLTVTQADIDTLRRTLVSKQTLHGPEIGFGLKF